MRIAVIGDLHYPELQVNQHDLKAVRNEFYLSFFRRFFSIDADLYVSIGDLTNFGTKQELREIYNLIDLFEKPFIHVLGNHDVYGNKRDDVLELTGQKRYFSISTDIAELAFIDTTRDQSIDRWDGTVDEQQLQWLANVVEQSETRPLLVFGHHPLHNTTAYSNNRYSSIHPNIPIWNILQRKQGNGLFVNGHNHIYSIAKDKQWTFTQLACVLDHQAVRIIDIDKHKIDCKTIDVSTDEMKKQAKLIGSIIEDFKPTTTWMKSKADLAHSIQLYQPACF